MEEGPWGGGHLSIHGPEAVTGELKTAMTMTLMRIVWIIVICLVGMSHCKGVKSAKKKFDFFSGVRKHGGMGEWGYVNVRPQANMFWWLYYTSNTDEPYHEYPLIIWLQGGPGASSSGYGNFKVLGPLDADLEPRNSSWVNDYNVLFIDTPVGSGFSYVESDDAYATTNAQIAKDLLECMRGFFHKLPRFASVPVYIMSESYGGKMAAEFAYVWYKAQEAGQIKSNLIGVGLGNPWISPVDSVMSWAPFLLQMGMIDTLGSREIQIAANGIRVAVRTKKWLLATELWATAQNLILRNTFNIDFHNILSKKNSMTGDLKSRHFNESVRDAVNENLSDEEEVALSRLMNNKVKKILGLNSTWGQQRYDVFTHLKEDFMKPAVRKVERLLNETNMSVYVYNGQLDPIVNTQGTLQWVEKLKWRNARKWRVAYRDPLIHGAVLEGYVKAYGKLRMYWINRSGRMVPSDNADATKVMLQEMTDKYVKVG